MFIFNYIPSEASPLIHTDIPSHTFPMKYPWKQTNKQKYFTCDLIFVVLHWLQSIRDTIPLTSSGWDYTRCQVSHFSDKCSKYQENRGLLLPPQSTSEAEQPLHDFRLGSCFSFCHYIRTAHLRCALFWQAETFRKLTGFYVFFRLWTHKETWMCCKNGQYIVLAQFLSDQDICPRTDFCVFSSLCHSRPRICAFGRHKLFCGWWETCPFSWINMNFHSRRNMLHITGHCTSGKAEKRKKPLAKKIILFWNEQTIIKYYTMSNLIN